MTILFAGGEDLDFQSIGGANGQWSSTASMFRSGYARGAWQVFCPTNSVDAIHYAQALFAATTQFWTTFRLNYTNNSNQLSGTSASIIPLRFCDVNGIVRLRVRLSGVSGSPNDTFVVEKINAAGTVTQLGSASPGRYASANATGYNLLASPDKIDVFVNYATAGQFTFYLNGAQQFTYSGDVTTDSVITLAGTHMGNAHACFTNGVNSSSYYSEAIVATIDTRSLNLVTQAPTAFGNTHNFDAGTVVNISTTALVATGQPNPNYATTAGKEQEFQVTPALPSGSFSVTSVVVKANVIAGSSGPQNLQLAVRTGGSDFTSGTIAAGTAWNTVVNNWDLNPNTGLSWAVGDLANTSTVYNIGALSLT